MFGATLLERETVFAPKPKLHTFGVVRGQVDAAFRVMRATHAHVWRASEAPKANACSAVRAQRRLGAQQLVRLKFVLCQCGRQPLLVARRANQSP